MSFSVELDAIQELRRADDPTIDQGEWVTALKLADWTGVRTHCEKVLGRRSKDLRVAAWLTDACARLDGYAGLADGLTLCRSLCERYWDALHPQLEDGNAEQRAGSLRWLLTQVETLATRLPVLRDSSRALSLVDIESAQAFGRAAERSDSAAPVVGQTTPDDVAALRRATPHDFFTVNLAEARRALHALGELQLVIDARLGQDGPGFATARNALQDTLQAVERLAREADPSGAATALTASRSTQSVPAGSGAAPGVAGAGPLQTRAEALQQLRMVADFFRRTEPHSPVAYLAERAATWGEMPLHAWLRAVVKDSGALAQMEELLGVDPEPPPAE